MITNLDLPAEQIYEFYTGRGRCENHIKELKNAMLGDRMSCHAFAANQFRLLVHVTAYILMYLLANNSPAPTWQAFSWTRSASTCSRLLPWSTSPRAASGSK